MNSTKIWFSSNISMREEFYKLLHNAPGVSRKKLHQIGKVENYNWGAYPHYYVDNWKELHGLMRSLERIENLIRLRVYGSHHTVERMSSTYSLNLI